MSAAILTILAAALVLAAVNVHLTKEVIRRMSTQEQQLDAALAAVNENLGELRGKVDQIIEALGKKGAYVDLTDETAALQRVSESLQAASDAIDAALTPPAA